MKKKATPEELYKKMCLLCSKTEKSSFDIQQKLKNEAISVGDLNEILQKLKENKFIDENRFALAFVHDKFSFKHWGKLKIFHALKMKQIPEKYIDDALASIEQNDYENCLRSELEKKSKLMFENDPEKKKQKLIRYLHQKGFENDLIFRNIDRIFTNIE